MNNCQAMRPPGGSLFRSLSSVLRTTPITPVHAGRVQGASNNVVPNAGEILDSPPPNQDNRVLLEGVTDTGDISVDLIAIGQTNTGNFPQCRVGLLGRCGKNTQAHSAPLRALGQIWRTGSRLLGLTALAYQLLNCRHATSASCLARRDPAASLTIRFRAIGRCFSPARRTAGLLSGSELSA